ncbi:tetratricopeptide repeat protein [Pelomyxa schiedti]|nr:tetratricopeptide repeat protein [Pelomyxa schiedti]
MSSPLLRHHHHHLSRSPALPRRTLAPLVAAASVIGFWEIPKRESGFAIPEEEAHHHQLHSLQAMGSISADDGVPQLESSIPLIPMAAVTATHFESTHNCIGSFVEKADAMSELARCYRTGDQGVAKNLDEALRRYNTACDGRGLFDVGCDYYNGSGDDGYNRNTDKAVSAWTMAAHLRYNWAMARLGWCYQHGVGVERDQQMAVSFYTSAISVWPGHSWRLGVCYLRGESVQRDWAMTVQLIHQSGDNKDAQAYLGWCYLWGCGVAKDVAKGVELLNCALGIRSRYRADVFLGYCHERGVGVVQDTNKAQELYNKAKSTPLDAGALGEIGEYCERGDCGAPTDKRAAVGYFQMGAEGGDPVSMFHLGVCLRDGVGVDCDVDQSHHWLVMAAKLGHRGASNILSEISSSSSVSNNGRNNVAVQQEEITPETLKNQVESLKEQLLEERAHYEEQFESLKKQVAQLEREKAEVPQFSSFLKFINFNSSATPQEHQAVINLELQKENEHLESCAKTTEAALFQEQTSVANLRKELQEEVVKSTRYMTILNTMTSLISANVGDFDVEKLLGTGSNAAVFKVQFTNAAANRSRTSSTTTPIFSSSSTASCSASASDSTTTDMVMKIIFNWENTPQQTLLRRKYMAECVVLSLVPNHPNVIHPLGALVIPCTVKVKNLFVQGLKAISHIESHFVVHRDIKGDNILVDPETGKLTLIDFGEAQHCPSMEMMVSATSQPWGNTGMMPPELSMFLKRITRGTSSVFSYSKCDSFALALTFWDALLPQSNRFIGSTMNGDMSTFNTQKLLSQFPLHSVSSVKPSQPQVQPAKAVPKSRLSRAFPFSLFSSAASPTPPQPLPTQTTTVTLGEEVDQNHNGGVDPTVALLVESVMIRMMNPDKAARLSAADAISALTQQSPSTNKL